MEEQGRVARVSGAAGAQHRMLSLYQPHPGPGPAHKRMFSIALTLLLLSVHYQRRSLIYLVFLEERKNKKGQPLKLSKSRGKSLGQSIPGNQEGDELL